jgi:hypothetical protein
MKRGCAKCDSNPTKLKQFLRALKNKVILDQYDDIAIGLHACLILMIGNFIPIARITGYWGVKSTGSVLSYSDILLGTQVLFDHNSYVDIPYNYSEFNYMWFAIPATEPIKNAYQDLVNSDNYGDIGSPTDLMDAPTLVTGIIPLDFYISVYGTPQLTTLRFKTQ